jgi:hypothetical protein
MGGASADGSGYPAALYLRQSPAGLDGLALLLHGRLFISAPQLEFLEQTALGEFVLENLQGLFHVIVEYFYFQIPSPFLPLDGDTPDKNQIPDEKPAQKKGSTALHVVFVP